MKHLRPFLLLALLLAVVLAAIFLPVEALLTGTRDWAAQNPADAFYAVTAGIAAWILLLLPVSLVIMLAGFLFGLGKGFAAIWLAGLVASAIAFLAGRGLARPWLERRIHRKPMFIAIDRAIQRKGFLIVLLTRLVMVIPYPALNYMLGLTRVNLRDYLLGTNIGMAPPFFLFVYLGTTLSDVTDIVSGQISLTTEEWLAGLLALVVVIVAVALIIRQAAATLRQELARLDSEPE